MSVDEIIRTTVKSSSAILITLLGTAGSAYAAETNKFTVEEAIKDMKPASFSCEVNPDSSILTTARADTVEPDVTCALSAKKLNVMLQAKKNIVLVDTRKNKDFASFSIPGAMNLTASAVRRKSFLQKKTIVLIGDGKAEKAQYRSCAILKNDHFADVKVLKGGMLSWVAKHLPINGKANLHQMGKLSPLEFWAESKFSENLIVIDVAQKVFKQDINSALVVNAVTTSSLKGSIKKRQKTQKKTFISAVVIVAAERSSSQHYAKLRQEMFPVPVLVYSGTYQQYKAQLKLHEAVMLAKRKGPKKPGCHL